MQLIVGLGNYGEQYEHTRHNVGFMIVDELPAVAPWDEDTKTPALRTRLDVEKEVELIKPLTMMNRSGKAVSYVARKHKIKPEDILVIHDDLDIPTGQAKMTFGKSAAKHNGVASVIDSISTQNFWRLRIGIVPPKKPPAHTMKEFVLKEMTPAQEKKMLAQKEKLVEGILLWAEDHEKGMQFINTK